MNVRHNHRDMTSAQKQALINAILKLKNNVDSVLQPGKWKRYDDFVQVHKNAMMGPDMFMPMPHHGPLFYPWHRILLRQFELALQAAAGDPTIAVPYWDWNISGDSNPFTVDFMGGDGDEAQNQRVTTGPFAFSGGKFPIRVWDDATGDAGLRRQFGDDPSSYLPSATRVVSDLTYTPYSPAPSSWEVVSEGDLHNPVHRWVGGNMGRSTSPNDPIFFLHHCYMDMLWERWKQQHPTIDPYLPTTGNPGYDLASTLVFFAPGKIAPWSGTWTVRDTLSIADLGYAYG